MKFFNRDKQIEVKESPFTEAISANYAAPERNMDYFYIDGYRKCSVVYKCVNKVANAGSTVQIEVVRKIGEQEEVLPNHPLTRLLNKPNPRFSREKFIKSILIDYMVAGELFVGRDDTKNEPRELWRASPTKMSVVGGAHGVPQAYEFESTAGKQIFPVEMVKGRSDKIFHYFMPNPLDDWRGLSPLYSVADWVDVLNEGAYWNASLLHNGGNLSGIISIPNSNEEAVRQFISNWRGNNQGAKNAGKTAVISADVKYAATAPTPKDMDFERSIAVGTRAIADAYAVPFPLVSPEASTFNNMEAALEDFYTDTVLPLMQSFYADLGEWLLPQFKDNKGIEIRIIEDSLPALEARSRRKAERIKDLKTNGIITTNEARQELGYDLVTTDNADELLVSTGIIPLGDTDLEVDAVFDNITKALDGKAN